MKLKNNNFNSISYYNSYPKRIILRPGYPSRAQYKSNLMWNLYSKTIMKELNQIKNYADIGGAFGFGTNALAYRISKTQGKYPNTKVFEVGQDFVTIGKQLFQYIDFILEDFRNWKGKPKVFDLVSLFDIIEHLKEPEEFLSKLASHSKLALLTLPMETQGDWFGGRQFNYKNGENHEGHINFFNLKSFLVLLDKSNWEIIGWKIIRSIVPIGTSKILIPELIYGKKRPILNRIGHLIAIPIKLILPNIIIRKIFGGGRILCLIKSRKVKY